MMLQFNKVDKLLNLDDIDKNNLLYCDTDSLFLQLPVSLEDDNDEALEYINSIQDNINNVELANFLHKHNIKIREKEDSPLLPQRFKNEYMIKVMVMYSKKRYITIVINRKNDGSIYYEEDLKGVEGKKGTYIFIKLLVEELVEYLKSIKTRDDVYDRFDIYNKVILKYRNLLKKFLLESNDDKIGFFGFPVSINKPIGDLKNVPGFYRGCIVFDSIIREHWNGKVGKGIWLRVKLKDESKTEQIINAFKQYPHIKIKKNLFNIIKDITIPDDIVGDNNIINEIFNYFDIDFDVYFEVLLKKIALLYKPFDFIFCNNLIKLNNKNKTLGENYFLIGKDYSFKPKNIVK